MSLSKGVFNLPEHVSTCLPGYFLSRVCVELCCVGILQPMNDLQHTRNAEMWLKYGTFASHSCLNPSWIHRYDSHGPIFQIAGLLNCQHIHGSFADTVRCTLREFHALCYAAKARCLDK